MPTLRPQVDVPSITSFLRSLYPDASSINEFTNGVNSLAFAFSSADTDLVLRVSRHRQPYERDAFAYKLLAGTLPVPEVLAINSWPGRDLHYAISRRLRGEHYSGAVGGRLILDGLDIVHTTALEQTRGYGPMDARGVGEHSTWEESLRTLTLTRPHDDWLKRARQFPAWSEELWQLLTSRLYAATEDPLPPVRALIHGDFGHANLLVANGKLNAVLDWGHSRFGDPLCDCVWIDCWNGGERNVSASYCRRHLISRADAEIRLRPIELSITRNMLTSFAATSQVSKYGYANNLAHYYLRLHS